MSARIERIPIESSSLVSVGYSDDERILEAEFKNGAVYRFFLVPVSVWTGLLEAESKGAYFNRRIRDHYPHAIAPPPPATGDLTHDLQRSIEACNPIDKNHGERLI